jgi:hypothetical protein
MTKYMKITPHSRGDMGRYRTDHGDLYIDLYKINRIHDTFYAVCPHTHRQIRATKPDCGRFATHFSIPGARDMAVLGPAHEFIAHIEEQQKRARKGKEVEPYAPHRDTLWTPSGKVFSKKDQLSFK